MLIVKRSEESLAEQVIRADNFLLRLVGLMGRTGMDPNKAVMIEPCRQVHSWFVFFSLDLLFLDEQNIVLSKISYFSPFKISPKIGGARKVVEFTSGTLDGVDVVIGDEILIHPRDIANIS